MEFSDKDLKRFFVILLIISISVLVFLLLRPIMLAIVGGLILAYAFFPVYKKVLWVVRNKSLAASIVSLLIVALIVSIIYLILPSLIVQVFKTFEEIQGMDMPALLRTLFPSAQDAFITQASVVIENGVAKGASAVLGGLVSLLSELPTFVFNFAIVAFVFFFALRDSDKLAEFTSSLSPLHKEQEKKIVKQFKDITNSIVYGQIAVGIVQGASAGLGFLLFGIPNALILTALAIGFSIIPIMGPLFVWVPVLIYLLAQGNTAIAMPFLIYNLLIVANIDNVLRIYLITRKTQMSQVIVLIGMIGGLFIFGMLGVLLGPLLLAYFITFLNAYRDNTLSSLFKTEKEQ